MKLALINDSATLPRIMHPTFTTFAQLSILSCKFLLMKNVNLVLLNATLVILLLSADTVFLAVLLFSKSFSALVLLQKDSLLIRTFSSVESVVFMLDFQITKLDTIFGFIRSTLCLLPLMFPLMNFLHHPWFMTPASFVMHFPLAELKAMT